MFDGIRKLVNKDNPSHAYGVEVSVHDVDNEVESKVSPEPIEDPSGWVEPDGAACTHDV